MKIRPSIVTSADVLQVIEEARDAELCRNFDLSRDILSPFWEDIEGEPELSAFTAPIRGEFLRLCGVFLSEYGRAKGLPDYQIRAKDMLSRAADLFEAESLRSKAAEAKVGLANCYWFSGEINEYDDILQSIETEFGADPSHPVSIKIKLNRIFVAIWRGELKEAQSLIDRVASIITADHHFRLRTQFHNLAGIAFRLAKDLNKSAFHLTEAVSIARQKKNTLFEAFNLNNLAMVYRNGERYSHAHQTIDAAISLFDSLHYTGWMSHALDTKALIHLDEGESEKALAVIERSVQIFSESEDYGGLTDAMWTKCICLLRLGRTRQAFVLFVELTEIAARQIGQVAVDKFEKLLTEEVYILKHFPLTDELAVLKRSLVVKAMRESGGHVSKAAKALGLRSQQHLSDILKNQFPDIYDELGIKRRARRSAGPQKKQPVSKPGVAQLLVPKNRTYSFNFALRDNEEPQLFYFPRNLMREFGVKADAIVAVMPVKPEALLDGGVVLYLNDDTFRIGRLSFDEFTELFLVDLKEFIFLSDVQLIGVPIGYCPVSDKNKRIMKFERLQLIKTI